METIIYGVGAAVCGFGGILLSGIFIAWLVKQFRMNAKDAHLFITFMREKDNVRRYVESLKAHKETSK